MFTYNKEATVTNCEPGVTRKVLSYSEELMMCEITFEKGAKGNFHGRSPLFLAEYEKVRFHFGCKSVAGVKLVRILP